MNQIPDIVSKTIDVLSQKFGTTAQELWAICIHQAMINGYEALFGVGSCAVVLLIGTILITKGFKYTKKDNYDPIGDNYIGAGIAFAILAFIIGAFFVVGAIDNLLNPQYQALQSIIHPAN